jgi:flagellar hook protein FlgE
MSGPINFDSGLTGIRKGLDGIQKTASQIASKETMEGDSPHDLAESMVNLKVNKNQVSASAQVVKATDQMLGTLLDIKA